MNKIHKLKDAIKVVSRVLDKKYTIQLIGICLITFFISALMPMQSSLYMNMINCAANITKNRNIKMFNEVLDLIIIYMCFQLIIELLGVFNSYCEVIVTNNVNNSVLRKINAKIKRVDLAEFERPEIYDLLNRISWTVSDGTLNFIKNLINTITPIVSSITYIVIISTIEWYFPAIIILASIPFTYAIIYQSKEKYDLSVDISKFQRKTQYLCDIQTSREYAKEIKLFKLNEYLDILTVKHRSVLFKKTISLFYKQFYRNIFLNILKNLSLIICLYITCLSVIDGANNIGAIAMIIFAIRNINNSLAISIGNASRISEYFLYMGDWDKFMTLPEDSNNTKNEYVVNHIQEINLTNVSFKYPNSSKFALDDISISIKLGQKIAIVGDNGSGKSTFVNILLGLYKPTSGIIEINNHNLSDSIKSFRKKTVCIFQNFVRYNFTVEDNISSGNFGNSIDLNNALFMNLGINEMIDKIGGKDIQLGQLNNGIELSGGEWQKIAFARALARENSEIIIMDEPTASLDPKIENNIYENFTEICNKKTIILISHRLSATKLCDIIYVFDNGKIIEKGSHDDLLAYKGKYYDMYSLQSQYYA